MIRMGSIAPSKPEPANSRIISGANNSTKQIRGNENRKSNLKAVFVYEETKSNLFSFINTLIRGIITPVSVLMSAITT